jgi:tetratricopeptide (TPR) repeat protein
VAADSKAKLLNEAEKYILQGKIQPAISEYLKIVELDPSDVLVLNTIGDLYLRQRNIPEANKYFAKVAESYVHNNFFLKAIAVYKKILNADPNNLAINLTMASLYSKQGLSIDARNQYLRVAKLLEQEGNTKELRDVFEKIAELDPSNSAIQRKLAELYLSEGAEKKAHAHFTGAARAQIRSGDMAAAVDSYEHAMKLAPLDIDAMRGFLECCLKMGNPQPALDQLKKSVEMAPENLDMREMLGQAYLEKGDPEAAAKAFQVVISMDESRYENYFPVAQTLIERDDFDQTINLLDNIIPILITHRETDRARKLYEQILERQPNHIPSLKRLASIFSATGNHPRCMEILDQTASIHMDERNPVEALECLEKILHFNPGSEKHRNLHVEAFTQAYPDTPYTPPMELQEMVSEPEKVIIQNEAEAASEGNTCAIVEVDLLLNYGLRDKALSLLQSLESKDPCDKDVRVRLLSLYKIEKKYTEAAEQCLLLSVLSQKSNNEDLAQNYLAEARQLDPDIAASESDLEALANERGIEMESSVSAPAPMSAFKSESEVDLSSDLLDIFFKGEKESETVADSESNPIHDVMTEGFPQDVAPQQPAKSVQEQLQEVDFYIRLGFNDEALAKLNEIAKINPDNPELAVRYEKLGETEQTAAKKPVTPEDFGPSSFDSSFEFSPREEASSFQNLGIDDTFESFMESRPDAAQKTQPPKPPAESAPPALVPAAHKVEPTESDIQVNDMFADLMEEVSSPTDRAAAKASFEEHFSLGTAYREMELIEEAIKEFESALKAVDLQKGDPQVIQCCGMLSTCFLKKNMPRSALRWCQTGLDLAEISSHEAMALRYDMGIAHSMEGSTERALECFDQIFGLDPGYRDVAQRIDQLKGGFDRHASSP